jgi:hypothetical protein
MQSDIDNIDTIIQLLLISFMLSASYVGGGGGGWDRYKEFISNMEGGLPTEQTADISK